MSQDQKLFLAGDWADSPESADVTSPYTGEVIARVPLATAEQAALAVDRAAAAFAETSRLPSHRRYDILSAIAAGLHDRQEETAQTITSECGKPIKLARGEVARSIQTFTIAAEESKRLGGDLQPLDWTPAADGRWGITRRFPVGPVLGITPFNFPLNLVAHKVAPALAVGAPIIIKPATRTPLSALLLAELVQEAGWPAGGLSVLPCSTDVAGRILADDRIKKLSFTGSPPVGWLLKSRANTKKVTLELGGNAGVLVDAGANLDYAAQRCVFGGFAFSGQVCIAVQRIYVHEAVHDDFRARFLEIVRGLKVGDPREETTDIGPMITEDEAQRAEDWVQEAVAAGAEVLIGGTRDRAVFAPTVLSSVTPEMKVSCLELFAPIVTLVPVPDFETGIALIDDTQYGLQAGVFTPDLRRAWYAFEHLEAGGIIINDVPTFRVDQMPYGGMRNSGVGREGVRYAMQEMTELRHLVLNLSV